MAGQELRVRTHLRMEGKSALSFDNMGEFPLAPQAGQFALVEGILYIYASLGGVQTWFPLTNKKNSHVHYQAIASTKWVISHNYASTDLMYFAYDANNNLMVANPTFIDENKFELNFGTAVKGKCVVFVHSDLWLPRFETTEGYAQVLTLEQYLKVAGESVILDSTGVTVNGVNLSTWIQGIADRTTLLEGVVSDNGTHGEVHKTLRPVAGATEDVDLGDVNQRFGQVNAKGLSTEDVQITKHTVDAVTDVTNTADANRGKVSGNVLEAHARVADGGEQAAEVRLIGTDGSTYFLRQNTATGAVNVVDQNGQPVDITGKNFSGADMVLTGNASAASLTVSGDAAVGTDAADTLTVNAATNFNAPISLTGEGSLGNGDDNVAINCGPAHLLTVISQYFNLDENGLLTVRNLTVSENLDVAGTKTEANATTVVSGDQYLTLLNDVTGAPSLDGGVQVVRGDEATAVLRWDEVQNLWTVGTEGDMQAVVRSDDPRLLTEAEKTGLTGGADSDQHFHAADRDRANHTGTQTADTISDFASAVASTQAVQDLQTGKVDAVAGKGLSTHDLTDTRLQKLDQALTEVSWSEIKDAPDLSGAGPQPADEFTLVEVANLRSGKTATGETMKQTKVFGGEVEPLPEEAGDGDIWFDTGGESTVVKVKDKATGEFVHLVKVASEMIMKHSLVNYVTGPTNTTHTFTYNVDGLPQPMKLKADFLTVYLNRQLLRKDEYDVVDDTTIEILIGLSEGDEIEVVTA